ncbi:macrophage expressed protein [Elysia marginata]|uniref:Macrophage expressed protein n=1 Tax=Elysia marginata TaxID=1093978 RepID=A0AAV4HG35_9GAST|nr:macrophage expressed protein [Elysia marginata]
MFLLFLTLHCYSVTFRYEAKLQVDPPLSPQFKSRLMSLAARIELNHTEMAHYESQLIVRDFGTHVLKSVTAGAALVKDDLIMREALKVGSAEKANILASASSSFYYYGSSTDKLSSSAEDKAIDMQSYKRNLRDSTMQAFGGPLIKVKDMNLDEWVKNVDSNLIPIDRSGDPLYYLINPHTLPDLPEATAHEAAKYVRKAIEAYYDMNFIPGCTNVNSTEFSPFANFDDGSCTPASYLLRFGGVYQTCKVSGEFLYTNPCEGLCYKNPKTDAKNCPEGQTAVEIYSGTRLGKQESKRYGCYRCGYRGRSRCCRTKNFQATAHLTTYWCADDRPTPNEGLSFGGMYSLTTNNILTGAMNCPPGFNSLRLLDDLHVCMTDDQNENVTALSVPFGGFFSCQRGNPLASNEPKCPQGFSQQLASINLGCPYYYCVQSKMLTGSTLPVVKRPPFMMEPAVPITENANEDEEEEDKIVMIDLGSETWVKDEADVERSLSAQPLEGSASGLSAGGAAAIAIVCTLLVVVAGLAGFVAFKRHQYKSRKHGKELAESSSGQRRANQYGGAQI